MPGVQTPKVFISYSHDNETHAERVLLLARRLREGGIDAEIDQYAASPPEGWPAWSENQVDKAQFVLVVCTENYFREVYSEKESSKQQSALWEARLIRQLLYDSGAVNDKFIPVLFSDGSADHIPTPLKGATRYVVDSEDGYEGLYRQITKQVKTIKPGLGNIKPLPPKEGKPDAKEAARLVERGGPAINEGQERLSQPDAGISVAQPLSRQIPSQRPPMRAVKGNSTRGQQPIESSQPIHIIGWRGIEQANLYSSRFGKQLSFLTTERSFNTLPRLYFCRSLKEKSCRFDFIYMDVEFIERYKRLNLISNIAENDEIRGLLQDTSPIDPAILKMGDFDRDYARTVYAVPIQFGFNEVLINVSGKLSEELRTKLKDEESGNFKGWRYKDFELESLLRSGTRVALWDWYLPTLTHFLFVSGIVPDVSALQSTCNLENGGPCVEQLEGYVSKLIHLLDNGDVRKNLRICMDLESVRTAMDPRRGFGAGVILGIGSSVLNEKMRDVVRVVIPDEGVPMWINCAAALHGMATNAAGKLIPHWLDRRTQEKMFKSKRQYYGLPANKEALWKLVQDEKFPRIPIMESLNKLYDKDNGEFYEGKVGLRVLPRYSWRRWIDFWDKLREAINP